MLDLWYKTAVIYSLNVATYLDGNGDGIGDFKGLTDRLDYIAKVGVTCLWLLPFYPSPRLDYGYDVTELQRGAGAGHPGATSSSSAIRRDCAACA